MLSSPHRIRRLTADDADAWRTSRLEALQNAPDAFGDTYENSIAEPLEACRQRVSGPDPLMAAFVGGEIIGTAGCYVDGGVKSKHIGNVWGMYVAPAHRRAGIGKALLEAVIADVSTRVDQIHLDVVTGNPAAYTLYRQNGFTAYGIVPRAMRYQGRDQDLILMVRILR